VRVSISWWFLSFLLDEFVSSQTIVLVNKMQAHHKLAFYKRDVFTTK